VTQRPARQYGSPNATHNNKRHAAMFKQPKYRQAGIILFATAVILILPNLTRLVS